MLHQEDDLKVCPYNPSHLIRPKRMITHLTKCRKNYVCLNYQICPMDATHHIPPEQFEEHLEKCPKRAVVDVAICNQASNQPANPILSPDKVRSLLVPSEENWDDEVAPTYDPLANAANKNVMRVLKNAPPAEKRAFQLAERRRLVELQDREVANGPLKNVGCQDDAYLNVRMPATASQAFVRASQSRH